jgi:hypothetical protein
MAPIAPHFIQMTTVRPLYVRWRDHNTSVIWPDLLGPLGRFNYDPRFASSIIHL